MLGVQLALKSLWRNRLPHVVAGVAIISVLTPLMLLYGVKTGVVDGLVADLKTDPRVLALNVSGHISLSPETVARIRAMPDTRFILGATRSSAARLEIEAEGTPVQGFFPADVVPTAPGDPLLEALDLDDLADDALILSQSLADKLQAQPSTRIVGRNFRNGSEEIAFRFVVRGVLPESYLAGNRVLATEAVLNRLEAFLDGYAVPEMNLPGRNAAERRPSVESLRVYASSIEGVVALDRELQRLGFRVRSNAAQIMLVQNLDRVMTSLFAFIALVGLVGFVVSFWASLASVFEQYRRQASLLKLLGLSRGALAAFPVTQAAVISSLALAVSALLFAGVSAIINRFFTLGYVPGAVCVLRPEHFAVVAGTTYAAALLIALHLVRMVARLSPVEALRGP